MINDNPIKINVTPNCIFGVLITNTLTYNNFAKATYDQDLVNPFIITPDGIPVIQYHNLEEIRNVKSNIVVIDMITESYNVYEGLKDTLPKDKNYYIFANGTWDTTLLDKNSKLLYYNYFLFDFTFRHTCPMLVDFWQDIDYFKSTTKKFFFSCTVGKTKSWRDKLITQLLSNIKFDNYVLNYDGQELKESSRQYDVAFNPSRYQDMTNSYGVPYAIPIELYKKSNLLLVVETCAFDFEEFHLTEKTLKAVITGIPFIVVGSYKFLENLRALGFRTYNELWPEDYDNIQNFDDRITVIIELLNELHSRLPEWFENNHAKFLEIANHNKANLLQCNNRMRQQSTDIINILKNEI